MSDKLRAKAREHRNEPLRSKDLYSTLPGGELAAAGRKDIKEEIFEEEEPWSPQCWFHLSNEKDLYPWWALSLRLGAGLHSSSQFYQWVPKCLSDSEPRSQGVGDCWYFGWCRWEVWAPTPTRPSPNRIPRYLPLSQHTHVISWTRVPALPLNHQERHRADNCEGERKTKLWAHLEWRDQRRNSIKTLSKLRYLCWC